MNLEILRKRIEDELYLLDAVVFTGGEPLLQPDGIKEAAKLVKDIGLKLMLDTNGSIPNVVEKLLNLQLIDRVALDVKAPLTAEEYGKATGLHFEDAAIVEGVRRTLELCNRYDIEIEVRTTVAPTISDEPCFIRRIANEIKGKCSVYYLQQFDNTGEVLDSKLKSMSSPSREKMVELAEIAIREGLNDVYIKTREMGLEKIG